MLKPHPPTEHQEQVALFQWAAIQGKKMPALQLLFAIPNGGSRHPAEAKNLKAAGVKAGVPDLFLPVARGRYNGLFIELKRVVGSQVQETQKEWLKLLSEQGYRAEVCRGFSEAQNVILNYLAG